MKVIAIDVPELGNRSYLVHDGITALVVDPSRRSQEFIDKALEIGVKISAVFETHIHNDYVTGGYALAQKLGVPYYIAADDKVSFDHTAISPEQTVQVGELLVTALASPGHTHSHTSYLVEHKNYTAALFSGGSLLYGAVGRPDLVSAESTPELAKAQYETAQFYVKRLRPETILYPTHGFGSFCAATETESVEVSTIAEQLQSNHVYISKNKSAFVAELLAGLDAYPSYYAYMAPENLEGPSEPNLGQVKVLSREAVMMALHDGVAIIDMRTRTAYATQHVIGTYNIELNSSFATYVGWLIAWGTPLILIAETVDDVKIAQEQLSLIGRELLAGQATSSDLLAEREQTASYTVRSFLDLVNEQATHPPPAIIDVRRKGEWQKGHLKGAVNIPLHELEKRIDEVPLGSWVHCAGGFRASIAASILDSNAKQPVLINNTFTQAAEAGLIIIKEET